MKNAHALPSGRLLILGIACLGLNGLAFAQNEIIPRGTLNVDSAWIRVGAKSQLKWQIQYPQTITDIVTFSTDTITANQVSKMRVRVLGSELKKNGNNGNDSTGGAPIEVQWRKNNSDWATIFSGTGGTVIPTQVVLDTVVAKADIIDFQARGYLTQPLPWRATSSKSPNLVILKNGDPVPPQIMGKTYSQVGGFLKPYLSSDAKSVKIGACELLILVDLDQTQPLAVGFDYQDLGMLVSFE